MRGLCRVMFSALVILALVTPVQVSPVWAVEQTNARETPWDEIDRVLQEGPDGSEDSETDVIDPPDDDSEARTTAATNIDIGWDRLEQPRQVISPLQPTEILQTAPSHKQANLVTESPPPAVPSAPSDIPHTTIDVAPALAEPLRDPSKFYLPVKAYFETKGDVTLANFDETDRTTLEQFYDARLGEALWVTKSGLSESANALIDEIQRADDWGLSSDTYRISGLERIGAGDLDDEGLADFDIKLSLVAMAYARHARGDRIPDPTTMLSSYLDRKPNLMDRRAFLDNLAAAPDKAAYLRSIHPQHPQFELLRQKLLAVRNEAKPEQFEKIPNGPKTTEGKSHRTIALIRKRLNIPSPGLKPNGQAADDTYYDYTLARAVERFKERNGIEPVNATITPALRSALNAETALSEDVLLANMEQWRWMPEDLGDLHVDVNIPEFMVRVIKNGQTIHSERIVVGKEDTQTPIFSDYMKTVVFQPVWNVPESIKVNELLPSLRNGGNPISGRGLVVKKNGRLVDPWSIDWYRQDIRKVYIYQPPGSSNALGVVKFLFPNKHAVYLHDTPSKSLFNSTVRTFSHGCVRVRNPVQLAEVLMQADKGWSAKQVKDLINRGPEDNAVEIANPIRVHINYFTVMIDDAGNVKRYTDVYGHEKRITLALAGRFDKIAKGPDHLAPVKVPTVARGRGGDDWYYADGRQRRGNRQRYSYSDDYYDSYGYPPPRRRYKQPSGGGFFGGIFGGP